MRILKRAHTWGLVRCHLPCEVACEPRDRAHRPDPTAEMLRRARGHPRGAVEAHAQREGSAQERLRLCPICFATQLLLPVVMAEVRMNRRCGRRVGLRLLRAFDPACGESSTACSHSVTTSPDGRARSESQERAASQSCRAIVRARSKESGKCALLHAILVPCLGSAVSRS
eukprot:473883-Prorocentrum_minimum.AAC.4